MLSTVLIRENIHDYVTGFTLVSFMQGGYTLAHLASQNGHTETLALLLANKADINAARKVQQLKKIQMLSFTTISKIFTYLFSY
jgi:hypothetical protein